MAYKYQGSLQNEGTVISAHSLSVSIPITASKRKKAQESYATEDDASEKSRLPIYLIIAARRFFFPYSVPEDLHNTNIFPVCSIRHPLISFKGHGVPADYPRMHWVEGREVIRAFQTYITDIHSYLQATSLPSRLWEETSTAEAETNSRSICLHSLDIIFICRCHCWHVV